jgi:quinoprotein glucose dehydrogenase
MGFLATNVMNRIFLWSLGLGSLLALSCSHRADQPVGTRETGKNWPVYGGNPAGNRYSPLTQINRQNVQGLEIAWIYNSVSDLGDEATPGSQMECQPIVVDGVLYATNPNLVLFALDAAQGTKLWSFAPPKKRMRFNMNRGVMYWNNGEQQRILYSAGSFLYALDAKTGKLVTDFGDSGKVDLHVGLDLNHGVSDLSVSATTPGVIYKNVLVLGSSVSEDGDAAPGYVRGFDVITGKLLWTFHTIPQPGEPGYDTWPKDAYKIMGGANSWSGIVLDEKRGMVFFGTGSPGADFYGGARKGKNLFANCIVALDAETGKLKWHFQTIHHDLWDRDIPCPPNLTTVVHDGKRVDVVVQATKDGLVYVLDRDNGKSLFPIEERPVPTQGLPGEHPWPTQRFPSLPAPFADQEFTDSDITDLSKRSHDYVKQIVQGKQYGKKFLPPNEPGTLLFGYSGGAEWGGNAVDTSGVLYVNSNHDLWLLQMISRKEREKEIASYSKGQGLYIAHCSTCHGMDRKGSGSAIPSLRGIGQRLNKGQISQILQTGRGRMPSFASLPADQREAIEDFLLNIHISPQMAERYQQSDSTEEDTLVFPYKPRYVNKVWRQVVDQDGYPGIKPPWGTLNAINLNTGAYEWRIPLGAYPELTEKGVAPTGTPNYGAPIVTAGGLVFIAATRDEKIHAFDKATGKVLWEHTLPAAGFAAPITYEVDGRQYIVIAAGGGRGLKSSGMYVAFALPAGLQ